MTITLPNCNYSPTLKSADTYPTSKIFYYSYPTGCDPTTAGTITGQAAVVISKVGLPSITTTSATRYPSTIAEDTSVGSTSWSNTSYASTDDLDFASRGGAAGQSYYLKATNFGFNIPTGATINGIKVVVLAKGSCPPEGETMGTDTSVKIVNAAGVIGGSSNTEMDGGNSFPCGATESTFTYGGTMSLWGETWTAANINDPGFGVAFSAFKSGLAGTQLVDYFQITVSYTY